ncbi:MAG: O-methyltransferase, partial [Lachnospiraceae bacterium]|nr:O-methyltransferase [Lachnospiraceae bacterium]
RNVESILEIGTATGYSAIIMANAMKNAGKIDTIERNEGRYEKAVKNVKNAGLEGVINIHFGDAFDVLAELQNERYDMAFIDAAKGQYMEFYEKSMPLLKENGIMVCDNVLQDGELAFSSVTVERRDHTVHRRMRDFLYDIKRDKELSVAVLTIGDGVLLVERS